MTKKELIDALAEYPDNMPVITEDTEMGDYYAAKISTVGIHNAESPCPDHHQDTGRCFYCKQGYEIIRAVLIN